MLEDLKLYLQGNVNEVRTDNILRAFQVLYIQFGDSVEDALQRLLTSIQNTDDSEAIFRIEQTLLNNLIQGIEQYGVFLNVDNLTVSDVDELTEILSALQQADNWEEVAAIHAALAYESDSIGTLSAVISVISGLEPSFIATYINRVSDSLILALRDIYEKKMAKIDEDIDLLDNEAKLLRQEEIRKRREALFQYIDKIGGGNEDTIRFLRTLAGRLSSYDPKELMDKCWNVVNKQKYNLGQQVNLWCLCLFLMDFYDANTGHQSAQENYLTLKQKLTEYYTDVNFLFTLSLKIDEVLGRG